VLSRLVSEREAPTFIRSDNGPEFDSIVTLEWFTDEGTGTALIEPRLSHASRARKEVPKCIFNVRASNGPDGARRRRRQGHSLKLRLVRRSCIGHLTHPSSVVGLGAGIAVSGSAASRRLRPMLLFVLAPSAFNIST
jgi:hypothetical protein